jgi:hypothetical protein
LKGKQETYIAENSVLNALRLAYTTPRKTLSRSSLIGKLVPNAYNFWTNKIFTNGQMEHRRPTVGNALLSGLSIGREASKKNALSTRVVAVLSADTTNVTQHSNSTIWINHRKISLYQNPGSWIWRNSNQNLISVFLCVLIVTKNFTTNIDDQNTSVMILW